MAKNVIEEISSLAPRDSSRVIPVYWSMEVALDANRDDGTPKTENELAIEAAAFAFDEVRQCEHGVDRGPSVFRAEVAHGHVYVDASFSKIVSRVP